MMLLLPLLLCCHRVYICPHFHRTNGCGRATGRYTHTRTRRKRPNSIYCLLFSVQIFDFYSHCCWMLYYRTAIENETPSGKPSNTHELCSILKYCAHTLNATRKYFSAQVDCVSVGLLIRRAFVQSYRTCSLLIPGWGNCKPNAKRWCTGTNPLRAPHSKLGC